jgi:hypothetical protein
VSERRSRRRAPAKVLSFRARLHKREASRVISGFLPFRRRFPPSFERTFPIVFSTGHLAVRNEEATSRYP